MNSHKAPKEIVKVVLSWCDSRVNGSFTAMIGVIFGTFGLLRLYPSKDGLPFCSFDGLFKSTMNWKLLTVGYGLLGILALYLFFRMVAYSTMANLEGGKIGTYEIFTRLKVTMHKGTSLDNILQQISLYALGNRLFILILCGLIYGLTWFAVAFQF